ncbi:MAG: FG-GAP repeat protein, partial [Candidatus Poseidoniales archaeon]
LGDHNLDANFIETHGGRPDQFGYSVAIDADMIAVGAPNHNFESLHDHSVYVSGEFIRKEFGRAFEIAHHVVHDLGSSGVRIDGFANNSGTMVLNNGAVFTFRNHITINLIFHSH